MSIWYAPPASVDVAIVGGGLVGTSLAYHLAQKGIDCCLLERGRLAQGASGRNDGQIILETADYYPRMKEIYGEDAAYRLMAFKRAGQMGMHHLLVNQAKRRYLAYHQRGSLTLAYNQAEALMIERAAAAMIEDGFAVELVDREQISEKIGTRFFEMGKWDGADASVNPAELTRLLADEARRLGAVIVEGCEVTKVDEGQVHHNQGSLDCEVIILATNAYTAQILPEFESLIFPIRGQVLATEPLDTQIAPVACITNFGYDYWHWTQEGQLILGGRRYVDEHGEVGFDERVNPQVQKALEGFLEEIYPQFAGVPIHKRWSGIMGFSKDGRPLIGPIGGNPQIWCAAGFTGYGLGMCWAVGEAVAQVLNDEESALTEALMDFSPGRFT